MPEFFISRRTALTEIDLLAAFAGAVEAPEHPPRESDGIEGTAEWGVMRWRERTYSMDTEGGGVSFGPKCEARVTKADGVLTIRGTITPSLAFWLVPMGGALAILVLFLAVEFAGPGEWRGPRWISWLLPLVAALFIAKPLLDLRRSVRDARAFLEGLLDSANARRRGVSRA